MISFARALPLLALTTLIRCSSEVDPAPPSAAATRATLQPDHDPAETDAGEAPICLCSSPERVAPFVELTRPAPEPRAPRPPHAPQRRPEPRPVRGQAQTRDSPKKVPSATPDNTSDDALRDVGEDASDDPLSGLEDLR